MTGDDYPEEEPRVGDDWYAVINRCHGGFGISPRAMERLAELGHPLAAQEKVAPQLKDDPFGWERSYFWASRLRRDDPLLVQVVRELGEAANGENAKLVVVKVPWHVERWELTDRDGMERVRDLDTRGEWY